LEVIGQLRASAALPSVKKVLAHIGEVGVIQINPFYFSAMYEGVGLLKSLGNTAVCKIVQNSPRRNSAYHQQKFGHHILIQKETF
jgi:hypothetical protein